MARMCLLRLAILGAIATGAGCLPDKLSDEVVTARITAAQDGAASTGDVAGGAVCGNGKLEGDEQCDPGAEKSCGDCEKCRFRRAMDVAGMADVAKTPIADKYVIGEKVDRSYSAWLRMQTVPSAGGYPVLGHSLVSKNGALTVAVGLYRTSDKVESVYPACIVAIVQPGLVPLKPDETNVIVTAKNEMPVHSWHHVRCLFIGGAKIGISVDGGDPVFQALPAGKLPNLSGGSGFMIFGGLAGRDANGKETNKTFVGQIDDVQLVTNPASETFTVIERRASNENKSVSVFHMDAADGDSSLRDSAPAAADAGHVQWNATSKNYEGQSQPLRFVGEDCYGFGDAPCSGGKKAPWCH